MGTLSPSFVVLPHVRKLNYNPLTDFVPICELATFPPLIVVNSDSPYHTLADFITAAHARPGTLTYGTIGPATASQIAFEMLQHAAKADVTFVPFTGYTPAIQALLAHQVRSYDYRVSAGVVEAEDNSIRIVREFGSLHATR